MTMVRPSSERPGTAGEEEADVLDAVGVVDGGEQVQRDPCASLRDDNKEEDDNSRWRKISVSMAARGVGELVAIGAEELMPLSCQGLCEAEMTMPAAKRWAQARKATAGVVMTPADSTVAPPAVSPAVSAAAIQSDDSRVSWPMRTRGDLPRWWARAMPTARMVGGSSGG